MAAKNITLWTSPRPRMISRLSQCPSLFRLIPAKRYSDHHRSTEVEAERASSTAEEFKRIAEEKLKEAGQAISSQEAGKVREGTEEARPGDSDPISIEKECGTHGEGTDYQRRPTDD